MRKLITFAALTAAAYEIYYHHLANRKINNKQMNETKGKIKERLNDTKEKVKEKVIAMIDEI